MSSRANLVDLSSARQPLAGKPRPDAEAAPDSLTRIDTDQADSRVVDFPSLETAAVERMISFTFRMRASQLDAIEQICRDRRIDKSALVRDFVDLGLRRIALK